MPTPRRTTPRSRCSRPPVASIPVTAEPRPPRLRRSDPRRPKLSLIRRMAVLGGADNDVLDEVPEEVPRFVQMFLVLGGTALVSALSMMFALLTGVRVSILLAIPLAIVWGLIIFNLDRFLTSTMRSTKNVFRLLGLAFPRVIMAALIGIVVAEPLVLQVFQNDIAREVNATNVTQALTDQDAVTSGPEKQALDAASAQVSALENQAATGIVTGTSSTSAESAAAQQTVDQLTQQLAAQQTVIDQARAVYQCELTGQGAGTVPGCTGVAGDGASSDAAQAQLAQAQSAYDALSTQLQQAQSTLAAANTAGAEAAASSADQEQAAGRRPAPRRATAVRGGPRRLQRPRVVGGRRQCGSGGSAQPDHGPRAPVGSRTGAALGALSHRGAVLHDRVAPGDREGADELRRPLAVREGREDARSDRPRPGLGAHLPQARRHHRRRGEPVPATVA